MKNAPHADKEPSAIDRAVAAALDHRTAVRMLHVIEHARSFQPEHCATKLERSFPPELLGTIFLN
jgi:hypothetical protein